MFAHFNKMLTSQACTKIENTSGQGDFSVSNKAIITSTPFKKPTSVCTKNFGVVTKSVPGVTQKLSDTNESCHETLKEKHSKKSSEEVSFGNFENERKSKFVTFTKNSDDSNVLKDITLLNMNRNFCTPKQQLITKENNPALKPLETRVPNNQNIRFENFNSLKNAPFVSLQFTKEPLLDGNEISLITTPFVFTEKLAKVKPASKKHEHNKMLPFFHFMYHKNLPLVSRSTNKLEMKIREPQKKIVQLQTKMKKSSKCNGGGSKPKILSLVVIKTNRSTQTEPEVILSRVEYYTLPLLEELPQYKNKQGRYVVPEFTIGRVGYGSIHFPDEIDVTDLNLDEIVHISHKQIVIYPDKTKKPPLGQGLNRPAQITLNKIWPLDKNQKPIKDADEPLKTDFTNKLKNTCILQGAAFKSYEFLTGTWIFTVKHT